MKVTVEKMGKVWVVTSPTSSLIAKTKEELLYAVLDLLRVG